MIFIAPPFGNYLNFNHNYFISVKGSFTLEPREGLIISILKTLRYSFKNKGWVNKIGLKNKGIDWAIKNEKSSLLSIAIIKKEDIKKIEKKVPRNTNIELNISCPNIDKDKSIEDLSCFLNDERKWCIVKLSPVTSDKTIDNLYNMGFRQFHCCNTLPIKEGGLSGPKVKPYSLEMIKYIKQNYKDTEIIGGGGIQTINDISDYKKAGADHFSISTLCFSPLKFLMFYKYFLS